MPVTGVGDSLMNYVIGQAAMASAQRVQTAVAAKIHKVTQQAQQSVLQLLDSAAGNISPATASLTAKVSGSGCNLDTYA